MSIPIEKSASQAAVLSATVWLLVMQETCWPRGNEAFADQLDTSIVNFGICNIKHWKQLQLFTVCFLWLLTPDKILVSKRHI